MEIFSEENVLDAHMQVLDYRAFVECFLKFSSGEYFLSPVRGRQRFWIWQQHWNESCCFSKRLYPNSRVIAFEPDRETFDVLQVNVRKISGGRRSLQQAVYPPDGITNFYNPATMPVAGR